MRRLTLTTVALAAALALAGCGGDNPDNGGAGSSAEAGDGQSAEGLPTVEGEFGVAPVVTFPDSEPPADLRVATLSEGDGAAVGEGDYIVANYIGQVWDAEEPFNDSFEMGNPIGFSLDGVIAGWSEGIPGASVGERLLLSIPSEKGYPEGMPDAGIEAGDTLVFVIDVLGSYSEDALFSQADARDTGEIANLPVTVTGAPGEQPSIQIIDGAESPTEVTSTVIAEGTGEPVGDSGVMVVAFGAVGWDNTPAGDSWTMGQPETIPVGVGTAFDQLVGVPTGSRAVIQMPEANGTPAMAAVVEVVDFIPTAASE